MRLQRSAPSADGTPTLIMTFCKYTTGCMCIQRLNPRRMIVLYTIAVVLLILWLLGLVTSVAAGGLIHILLVVAVVLVVVQLITGRRVV